ncbi:MAG: hypothetical protein R3A44_14560 [Caldilineaceae bacterium]
MPELAKVGDFCPHEGCGEYGKHQLDQEKPNIIKVGRSRQGRQRYKCTSCGQAFCETTGTLFHGRRTPEQEIIECLALIAEGMRISSVSRVKGFKEDTILAWLRAAGLHAEAIEDVLLADYQAQVAVSSMVSGPMWATKVKKGIQRAKAVASSGAPP